jgi:di/tricarboxylate transporter
MWLVVIVIIAPLFLVVDNRWQVDIAAFFIIVTLGLAQFLGFGVLGDKKSPQQTILAISGFGQPVVVTLIGLFILTQTLTNNGVMLWLGQRLVVGAERSVTRLIFIYTHLAALLSVLMNNIAVGSLLLPSAMQVSGKARIRPSKLLIPIAFGTALGGMATYFTTANIIMSNLLTMAKPPQAALGVLSFLTPMAHPVNLIMMGPGNYRFKDFFRVGIGLMVVVFLTLLAGMILFWRH